MTKDKQKLDSESKLIKKSFDSLKEDIKNNIEKKRQGFLNEFDLQGRLYHHLCNAFGDDEFYRIHLEHNPHKNYDKDRYNEKWNDCLRKFGKDKNIDIPEFREKIAKGLAKRGKYDISIFDVIEEDKYQSYHAIELKKISSCNSDKHKGYEDLYVLSDLLLKPEENKDHIKNAKSYFFIYVFYLCTYHLHVIVLCKKSAKCV